jgi:hypothetical protein
VQELMEKIKSMPEGKERDELVKLTANQMKRDLLTWGHGSVDDEKVADDMARMTDGQIQIDLNKLSLGKVTALTEETGKKGRKKK